MNQCSCGEYVANDTLCTYCRWKADLRSAPEIECEVKPTFVPEGWDCWHCAGCVVYREGPNAGKRMGIWRAYKDMPPLLCCDGIETIRDRVNVRGMAAIGKDWQSPRKFI